MTASKGVAQARRPFNSIRLVGKEHEGDTAMSETRLSATELPLFHPAAHYKSPADVLADAELSEPEKRIILSSWASDM